MNRRSFVKTTALSALAMGFESFTTKGKTHILTLSFDDGFKKSFYRTAEIHENYGLKACLNVIASGHLPEFKGVGFWVRPDQMGNFEDWNTLKSRGHEVMPHSWAHLNLTQIPFEQATANMTRCLDYFEANLEGYDKEKAVYNFAFNASTEALDHFALQRVAAVRTGAWLTLTNTKTNRIPGSAERLRLGCWSHGPDNSDDYVEAEVNEFLAGPGGWLILNLHGLDGEGWGPVSTWYLDHLLRRLVKIDYLDILPTGEVIKELTK
ncbi:MAG: polysaccharide deacetylase family protein [Bacteroidia bacterium]